MHKILHAIQFATEAHKNQKRKGKETSYVMHPLSVGLLLAHAGLAEEIVIAGILHDTIEDTEVTYEEIVKKFGKKIADVVNDVTEQERSLSWTERKSAALAHVATMLPESVLVKTADVVHNMNDQLEDYKKEGDGMFARLNAGKGQQRARYEKLIAAIKDRNGDNPLLPELMKTFSELQKLWS